MPIPKYTLAATAALVLAVVACKDRASTSGEQWIRRCVAHNGSTDIARTICEQRYKELILIRVQEGTYP